MWGSTDLQQDDFTIVVQTTNFMQMTKKHTETCFNKFKLVLKWAAF
jgi:hypothetical protein